MQPDRDRQMRIGYVVKRFPRISETFIAQEILELERRGAEVVVFTLHENDQRARHGWLRELRAEVKFCEPGSGAETWSGLHERAASVSTSRSRGLRSALAWAIASQKGRRDLGQAVALVEAARERRIDHLHAHFANRPASVALLAHGVAGLPFSLTAHAKDIYAAGPSAAAWRQLARRCEFIATVSESNRHHLLELLGERWKEKIRLLYNGVDLDAIRPAPAEERPADGVFRLISVARQVPKKGICDLIAAAAKLRERGVRFHCSIVGDGPERDALVAMRDRHALCDYISFEGALPHEAVVERIRRSDALALPCLVTEDGDRDVLPTVLLEAMAAGLACVSTPVGGVPEIIADGDTGVIVPARKPAALADALQSLACDRALARRMGSAGRARAERLFDRRHNVAVLHGWLADSIREGARGADAA